MKALQALIIEDQSDYAIFFKRTLQELNFEVTSAINVEEAKAAVEKCLIEKKFPDLCIVDERLSDKKNAPTGLDIVKDMIKVKPVALILVSNWRYEPTTKEKARNLNIPTKFRVSKDIFKSGFEEGKEEFLDIVNDCIRDFKFDEQYKKTSYSRDYERFGYKDGTDSRYFFFSFDSIAYLEPGETSSQCKLHFKNGTYQIFKTNLGTIARQISMYYYPFVKVSKSLYVNLNEVMEIAENTVTIAASKTIPITDAQSQALREHFFMLHT